jgi:PP-loop superfamily ATP-utilizing enzyme
MNVLILDVKSGETMIKRCKKCVMPATTPNISFDNKGVCDYCHDHKKIKYKGEKELIRLFKDAKKKAKRYDCMVPISGGRDSAYTLLKTVKDYNMKVLAVNYENPYTHPVAKENIKKAIKKLNVDLVKFKLKNCTHEKIFKNNLKAWFKKPSPELIFMICIACKDMDWRVLRIARDEKIPYVISGGNPYEDMTFQKALVNRPKNEHIGYTILNSTSYVVKEVLKNPGYINWVCLPTYIKCYLYTAFLPVFRKMEDTTTIDIFEYIEWNEKEVISRISKELDWKFPKNMNSSWRFDCEIEYLKDFLYKKTIGMTEKDEFYSKLVREYAMNRKEALKRLKKENKFNLAIIKKFLKKNELEEIVSEPIISE